MLRFLKGIMPLSGVWGSTPDVLSGYWRRLSTGGYLPPDPRPREMISLGTLCMRCYRIAGKIKIMQPDPARMGQVAFYTGVWKDKQKSSALVYGAGFRHQKGYNPNFNIDFYRGFLGESFP